MPPNEMTAISVVPEPMSITMEPTGSLTGKRIPISRRHGFFHNVNLACSGGFHRVADSAYLYVRHP